MESPLAQDYNEKMEGCDKPRIDRREENLMATVERRSDEQIATLGTEIYARSILPQLLPTDRGKYVAIDVHTGAFEVNTDDYTAIAKLKEREPLADVWLERAGWPTAYKLRRI
jgi:hypothetical protein